MTFDTIADIEYMQLRETRVLVLFCLI